MDFFNRIKRRELVLGNRQIFNHKEAYNIAFGIDANYAIGLGVMLLSIIANNKSKQLIFRIITDDIYKEDIERINELSSKYNNFAVVIYYIDAKDFKNLPTTFVWSQATYYRFLIDSLIEDVEKILYLDVDMLCLNDFEELFSWDMKNNVALVVSEGKDSRDYFKCRYPCYLGKDYFNAGMMLINVYNWRKNKVSVKCMKLLNENKFKFLDQDALNAVIYDKVEFIDNKYNFINKLMENDIGVKSDTVFLHFAGTVKPWQKWGELYETSKLWTTYRNKSPWESVPVTTPYLYKHAKFMSIMYKKYDKTPQFLKWKLKYWLWRLTR